MPILGLTDRAQPTFPRLGKLRKGGPKGARRPGEDLNYWRFTSDNPAIVKAFVDCYGAEPQEVDILLPYALIEDNFAAWKEHWIAGGLQHRCDGETCTIWLTREGTYSRKPKACPGHCKEIGRLALILPPLIRAGFGGYVTLETHSLNDILSIQSTLLATKEHRGYEDMRGIGFVLRRVEETISTPGTNGKRVRRKKWLVKLEPAARWVRAQLQAAQHRAMLPTDIRTGEVIDSVAREIPGEEPVTDQPESTDTEETRREEPEVEESEDEQPKPHWIKDERVRKRFWAWTTDMALDSAEVHEALGVEHVRDYEGSMLEAKEQIINYVNRMATEGPPEEHADASTGGR